MSLRNVGAFLVQLHLVPAGKSLYKMVGMCRFGGGDHLFVGCIHATVADVFHDRALEKPGVLQNHAEYRAQVVAIIFSDIVAIQ